MPGLHMSMYDHADTILTLCPYTSALHDKSTLVFFPFNEALIPQRGNKHIDIAYFGSPMPSKVVQWDKYMSILAQYNYRYGHYNAGNMRGCTYMDKIITLSETKLALVHGLCNVQQRFVPQYKASLGAAENKAFDRIDEGYLPQIKSRMFEAAFTKAVMLCQHDPFNPIENFFEPDEEFVYFYNAEDLSDKIKELLDNDSLREQIAERAYERAINNYTTRHFVNNFLL